ncbi:transposase [Xanthomonas theicola]|uniref:transposase n=1 Tax=Xanthomonas theicola TaxID=56464 RepID=UPI001B808061|nr:transposase [Xanthomonas theicola]
MFCVDEKTAIQVLDRKDRMLPLSTGRAQGHGFENQRNGPLSLFAALNTATGQVLGKTEARHIREQFVNFLDDIVLSQPRHHEIHVICDNLGSQQTPLLHAFPTKRPRVHMHDTPTSPSTRSPRRGHMPIPINASHPILRIQCTRDRTACPG